MPAVTDLTFIQLNDALKQLTGATFDFVTSDIESGGVFINLGTFSSNGVPSGTGVIKAIATLMDAARVAQETANQNKAAGEKLTAFPVPTIGTPNNGAVPITRALTARAVLSSATQIVGTNA